MLYEPSVTFHLHSMEFRNLGRPGSPPPSPKTRVLLRCRPTPVPTSVPRSEGESEVEKMTNGFRVLRAPFKKRSRPHRFLPNVVCGAHDLREATQKAEKALERESEGKASFRGDSSYRVRRSRGGGPRWLFKDLCTPQVEACRELYFVKRGESVCVHHPPPTPPRVGGEERVAKGSSTRCRTLLWGELPGDTALKCAGQTVLQTYT